MKYLIFVLTLLSFLVASALLVLSLGNCGTDDDATSSTPWMITGACYKQMTIV